MILLFVLVFIPPVTKIIALYYRTFFPVLEKTCKKVGLRFGLCCVKFVILHPFSGSFGTAAVPQTENRSLEDLHTQKESTRDRQSFYRNVWVKM